MAKKTGSSPSGSHGTSFTDTKRVKDLIALMAENGLSEIELVEDKSRILLRRGTVSSAVSAQSPASHSHHAATIPPGHAVAAPTPPGSGAKVEEDLVPIKSPMVGTFYSAANPESDAFVSIGTEVEKDQTIVCIIEAMKVFNEIHSEVTGTVVKILVSNGQVVEFGQPLFLVKQN
jgi:acetyl-CoA carboxylase biotin carboxyl carrier protein